MSDFVSLAKYNGLSLMMWDSENYASENTKLASDFYKAGAQSQQQKIDEYAMVAEALDESYVRECKKNKELQKRIDEVLSYLGNCHRKIEIEKKHIENLLKGQPK